MKKLTAVLMFIVCGFYLFAQETRKLNINGYITNMQSVMIDSLNGNWINDNLIHNRVNINYSHTNYLSFGLDIRTRIFTGETVKYFVAYGESISKDDGFADLSFNIINKNSVIINTLADRAWVKIEKDKFAVTLGRQRINWGRTFAWNPNDIFNSFSFFDFDYPEKPGSDALRVQIYPSALSSVEAVVKFDSAENISAAALYRFNLSNTDFQILGGITDNADYVAGAGWESNLGSVSFRGEISYLHPKNNFKDTSGVVVASVAFDYSFSNSLTLQTEFLYNMQNGQNRISSFGELYSGPLSVKNLSFTEYNFLFSASYPVNPIVNISFSAVYFPKVKGVYFGPSVSFSVSENIDFSVFIQNFSAELPDIITNIPEKQSTTFAFLRLKYSF